MLMLREVGVFLLEGINQKREKLDLYFLQKGSNRLLLQGGGKARATELTLYGNYSEHAHRINSVGYPTNMGYPKEEFVD